MNAQPFTSVLSAQLVAQACKEQTVKHIVLCPGSRNAPIILAFTSDDYFSCYSQVDERSAAYFALGLSLATGEKVAVCTTSGTAAVNLLSAAHEAYYQQVPLVFITADRPIQWVDKADNQAIRQAPLFESCTAFQANLLCDTDGKYIAHNHDLLTSALSASSKLPVHINVPLEEPLYGFSESRLVFPPKQKVLNSVPTLDESTLEELAKTWSSYGKKLILVGQGEYSAKTKRVLKELEAKDPSVFVFSEQLGNQGFRIGWASERTLAAMNEAHKSELKPDLLITIGGVFVSKRIKTWLRTYTPSAHWHIDTEVFPDTYNALTQRIPTEPDYFLGELLDRITAGEEYYGQAWQALSLTAELKANDLLEEMPADTDMRMWETVLNCLPENGEVHFGNSSVVRYAAYFGSIPGVTYRSNRGTSGIDGSVSTAAGAAVAGKKVTLLIGELSFGYNLNGIWGIPNPENLRIIVMNNGGGHIFNLLDGPSKTGKAFEYIQTPLKFSLSNAAATFGFQYESTDKLEEIEEIFYKHWSSPEHNQGVLLELFSNPQKSTNTFLNFLVNLPIT